jgi:hypothetical protein
MFKVLVFSITGANVYIGNYVTFAEADEVAMFYEKNGFTVRMID